jgi:hypothetical protein
MRRRKAALCLRGQIIELNALIMMKMIKQKHGNLKKKILKTN